LPITQSLRRTSPMVDTKRFLSDSSKVLYVRKVSLLSLLLKEHSKQFFVFTSVMALTVLFSSIGKGLRCRSLAVHSFSFFRISGYGFISVTGLRLISLR